MPSNVFHDKVLSVSMLTCAFTCNGAQHRVAMMASGKRVMLDHPEGPGALRMMADASSTNHARTCLQVACPPKRTKVYPRIMGLRERSDILRDNAHNTLRGVLGTVYPCKTPTLYTVDNQIRKLLHINYKKGSQVPTYIHVKFDTPTIYRVARAFHAVNQSKVDYSTCCFMLPRPEYSPIEQPQYFLLKAEREDTVFTKNTDPYAEVKGMLSVYGSWLHLDPAVAPDKRLHLITGTGIVTFQKGGGHAFEWLGDV